MKMLKTEIKDFNAKLNICLLSTCSQYDYPKAYCRNCVNKVPAPRCHWCGVDITNRENDQYCYQCGGS